jgi:hypothetical protein
MKMRGAQCAGIILATACFLMLASSAGAQFTPLPVVTSPLHSSRALRRALVCNGRWLLKNSLTGNGEKPLQEEAVQTTIPAKLALPDDKPTHF